MLIVGRLITVERHGYIGCSKEGACDESKLVPFMDDSLRPDRGQ